MKIKLNSDDNLPLKAFEFYDMIIAVTSVFHEGNNYYSQAFLGECLYNLKMLEYDKIDVSEGINVNKTYVCVVI